MKFRDLVLLLVAVVALLSLVVGRPLWELFS
jgi:hypothetical protein